MPKLILHHKGETHRFWLEPNANILGFLRQQSLDLSYSCLSGRCGSCKARLLKGRVRMRYSDGLGRDELAEGCILLCQSAPESEVLEVSVGD